MLGSAFDASALQWWLRIWQEGVAPEMNDQILAHMRKIDVRDLLPKVRALTLVVHYRNDRIVPFEAGRELAAGIPGARFVPLEGDTHIFFFSDTRPLLRAIAEFLGDPTEEAERPSTDAAKVPSAPEAVQGIFSKEGEFWTIACRGEVFRLKDVRGLAYIAYLLGHPGEEFHVLSLASKVGGKQGEADALAEPAAEEQATQSDLTVGRMGDAGEIWTPRRRPPTSGEPQNYASSSMKRASATSLSWSIGLRTRLKLLAGSFQGRSGWVAVIDGRPRLPSERGST
jgi:hypothetical protein